MVSGRLFAVFETGGLMTVSQTNKIALVAPGPQRIQVGAIVHLPLALLSLAAWLRHYGEYSDSIGIIDTNICKPLPDDFSNAAVVGISAMTGSQIKYGLEVAAMARRANPDAVIVWGGIHPSLLPEQTVQHPLVDAVVIGEGEATFLEIVNAVLNGKGAAGIPGTYVQKHGSREIVVGPKRPFIDLNELPLPAYDLIDVKDYHGIEHQFDYQSSRGCPFRCAFCYNTKFCERRWRKKSPNTVVKELVYLQEEYAIESFGLVDDEFFIDIKRAEAIFDGILESGKRFSIIASCRLDMVRRFSPDLFRKMKRAGVVQMFFGAESGSPKMLKAIQKDITVEDIVEGARVVAEAGIRPILSFMSGFPGETLEDLKHTIDIILRLWNVHSLVTVNGIFPFNAYPGTGLYEKALDLGLSPPQSLAEWGQWAFQYKPDNPWVSPTMKQWMEISFFMVRFKYYVARYGDRKRNNLMARLIKWGLWPIAALVKLRMRNRWFALAWEWRLFAYAAQKTFGYL
jgi:radical SAM superfamily enzyme YgiQ (UPF0313 family)